MALVGFANSNAAEGLTPGTLRDCEARLRQWIEHSGDAYVNQVTPQDLRAYLAWLRTGYTPCRFNGDESPLSPKTIRNVYVVLCSFFTWAAMEFGIATPMKSVPAPHFVRTPVAIFSREEMEAMLQACELSRPAATRTRRSFRLRRPTASRDKAILLTLLDSGMRVSELCSLLVGDVDLKTGRIAIQHGLRGGAKGGKGRVVFIGKAARRSVWRYLAARQDGDETSAPLFLGKTDRTMTPNAVRLLVKSIGKAAGVEKCHPHRFRHAFAISYLRAGGDVFTLQALLGHRTLEMVRYYAQVAEIDVAEAHRRASPVDHWRL